ncbi:MAG: signal peptidase II [Planctomycetota bacterium]|jgi:signal peptidase II
MTKQEQQADQATKCACLLDRCKEALPDRTAHVIFWPIALLGVMFDLWTKQAVFTALRDEPDQSLAVIDGFLTFRMALNDGAAFGIASGQQVVLIGVSMLALVIILGVFLLGAARQRAVQVALGLFTAGVCGNLWDRLFNGGRVRDFIDVVYWPGRHWHTFNAADAMLCIAVGLLVITTLLTDSSCQERDQRQR